MRTAEEAGRRASPRARLAASTCLCLLAAGAMARPAHSFQARVRLTPVAGTRIAWYERGQGEPLMMLTGTGSTMAEWDPALLRLLARHHRLLLLDYPGAGASGPWHGRSFDSLAHATARLLRAIRVPRADVLGWSMGGFVAQRLAIDHPGRVSHLILAGTNPGGREAVLGTRRAQEIDSEPNPPLAAIMHELYPPHRQGEGRRFLHRLQRAGRSGEIPDDFHVAASTTERQVAAEGPWLRSDRNYRQLAGLEAPTLAVGGRADPVVPPLNLRRIAARAPHAQLAMLAGAHAFLFQERRPFSRLVERFLRREAVQPRRRLSPARRRRFAVCTSFLSGPFLFGPGVSSVAGSPSKRGSERKAARPRLPISP